MHLAPPGDLIDSSAAIRQPDGKLSTTCGDATASSARALQARGQLVETSRRRESTELSMRSIKEPQQRTPEARIASGEG